MNHLFVTSRKKISGNELDKELHRINKELFGEAYHVERTGDNWQIRHPEGYSYGFSCWLASQRKIEIRPEMGDFSWWVAAYFQDEIALRFQGKCSGEGNSDKWEPIKDRYPAYKDWYWSFYDHCKPGSQEYKFVEHLFKETILKLPQSLQTLS